MDNVKKKKQVYWNKRDLYYECAVLFFALSWVFALLGRHGTSRHTAIVEEK